MEKLFSQMVDQPIKGRDVILSGIALDSRLVMPGYLFCACKGEKHDGHNYIDQAIEAGAAALAVESAEDIQKTHPAHVVIPQLKQELGLIASRFYDHPSEKMSVVGVTGTNGKTSISHYIAELLQEMKQSCGLIGTLGVLHGEKSETLINTTPDAISLQKYLYQMYADGADAAVMEVSSHALEQYRCNGVRFSGAVFSNLSQDHLDYHGSMKAYFSSKLKLFRMPGLQWAVINRDDSYYSQLSESIPNDVRVISYSLDKPEADFYLEAIAYNGGYYQATLLAEGECHTLQTGLQGRFNLCNMLAAVAAVYAMGHALSDIVKACRQLKAVAGRMQPVANQLGITAVVDYAHTPDALENVLESLRDIATGNLIVVFGCGGNRDRQKRPLMAAVAEKYADKIIVTDDNPRQENPEVIRRDIMSGFCDNHSFMIPDRQQAIEKAVAIAGKGDVIVVAGKGHEAYQLIGNQTLSFDDVRVLQSALSVREGENI